MTAPDVPDDLALDLCVGDLVRLTGDNSLKVGIGLIVEIRRGSDDLIDLIDNNIDVLVGKPKIRVLWSKTKKHSTWMDADEISLVKGK